MRRERMRCRQWYFRGGLAAIGGVVWTVALDDGANAGRAGKVVTSAERR